MLNSSCDDSMNTNTDIKMYQYRFVKLFCIIHCKKRDKKRGIYGAGYICFVYKGASVPWIISVNNFQFFTNILETMSSTNMYYILYINRKVFLQHFCMLVFLAQKSIQKWHRNRKLKI